jgi:hypothetical protein
MRFTSISKLRIAAVVGLSGALVASLLVVKQHRALTALRQESLCQSDQVERLTAAAQDLSNRLVRAMSAQPKPESPPLELLRLRGEAGLLRRQLLELQQAAHEKTSAPSEGVSPEEIGGLRSRGQGVYEGLKALRDQLREKESDREALLQGIVASGIRDADLAIFQTERRLAAQSLEEPGLQPTQLDSYKKVVTDMDRRIQTRLEGILLGLDAQAMQLSSLLEGRELNSDGARLRWISDLERSVRDAGAVVGESR